MMVPIIKAQQQPPLRCTPQSRFGVRPASRALAKARQPPPSQLFSIWLAAGRRQRDPQPPPGASEAEHLLAAIAAARSASMLLSVFCER
jgi:hypothetical protein